MKCITYKLSNGKVVIERIDNATVEKYIAEGKLPDRKNGIGLDGSTEYQFTSKSKWKRYKKSTN